MEDSSTVIRGKRRGGMMEREVRGRAELPRGRGWLCMKELVWEWRKGQEEGGQWSSAGSHLWLPRDRGLAII